MEPDERARTPRSGGAGSVADPLIGRVLEGRYQIRRRIARGGMASVYEATDSRLDRTVAIKVMHAGLGDDDTFARRFVREARAAARLNHPNVVGVYDQGDEDGTVYLAMEYVPGHTLRDVIRAEAPLTPVKALALLTPVFSALAEAHRAGLVHRDVKPENVLIGDAEHGGRIKVADFGLAKAVSAETQHTATGGVLIGTVSYLAPELVVDGSTDARVDVYAAGVMLFELLTGTKPHEGESPIQVAYKHVHEDVPAPSGLVDGIPDYVDALVARATSRDRTQRPADASVLLRHTNRVAQALGAGVASDPELAADLRPSPAPEPDDSEPLTIFDDIDDLAEDPEAASGVERTAVAPFDPLDMANSAAREPARPPTRSPERVVTPSAVVPAPAPAAPERRPAPARAVSTAPRRRSRRGPLLLVLALLLVGAVGGGAYWFGWARYTTTPGVLGLTEKVATARIDKEGLGTEVGDPVFSETVPAGMVVSSDPEPGARVLRDGSVTIHLSRGPERYDVPKLGGMTEDQAQDALRNTNLVFGSSTQKWHETVAEGAVIRSDPAAGTTLKPGASVNLVISKGRRPIEVRDFTGKAYARADEVLSGKGLVPVVSSEEHSDTVAKGDVISQTPTSGTLHKGDQVEFVVSKGPELVEVPSVRAWGVADATAELEALGFVVRTEESGGYLGLGFVSSTDPSPGTAVPKGSTITLYLV